jgi:tetraacyldisaccharide 4'-kinase
MGIGRGLTSLWYGESAWPALLAPLAAVYGALVRARRSAYAASWLRAEHAGARVVIVGNLTVGGTGKTPLTIWLAQRLTGAGLRVGIVSRGYGRRGDGRPAEVQSDSDWRRVGDEPLLLARHAACPTIVAADRAAGARALVALGAQVVLADDGLQHLRLHRECEIVVVDGALGFGNGRLLPAGPLREPPGARPHTDVLVLNGPPEHASLAALPRAAATVRMRLVAGKAVRLGGGEPARALGEFAGQRVHAVAGIGNPARFFGELRAHGIEVIEHAFPDHHPYSAAELGFADRTPVLMTEKDAVKCAAFAAAAPLWYVPVSAQFSERDGRELLGYVLGRLGAAPAGGHG